MKHTNKEKPLKIHQPCPDCGHDGCLSLWENSSYCHSCGVKKYLTSTKTLPLCTKRDRDNPLTDSYNYSLTSSEKDTMTNNYTVQYVGYKGITASTMKRFNALTVVNDSGKPVELQYNYSSGGKKIRTLSSKEFRVEGDITSEPLFGSNLFGPGSAPCIVVTEGENDAMAAWQMLGGKYPCVSVRSASCVNADAAKIRDYINSFDKIYLCMDNDAPGIKAAGELARLFNINKVYHIEMGGGCKDAHDYLQQGRQEEFVRTFWNAKIKMPKGIINSYDKIKELLNEDDGKTIASFPFPTLDGMAYGIRFGEIVLIKAQEKVGKTEFIRAIEAHLLKTTDYNLGIIHLEEKEKRSVQGLASYELNKPCHLPDSGVSIEQQLAAYEKITKRDGRVHYYQHFGADDPDVILDVIRALVAVCGCKFIFLDHITLLVTGHEGDDERRKLDYLSTRLGMLTRELDFALFLVSHVNDLGQTRGSRNISKIADLLLFLERDIEADSLDARNTSRLKVQGNRFASTSGPAGYLWFDPSTYQVSEKTVYSGDDSNGNVF